MAATPHALGLSSQSLFASATSTSIHVCPNVHMLQKLLARKFEKADWKRTLILCDVDGVAGDRESFMSDVFLKERGLIVKEVKEKGKEKGSALLDALYKECKFELLEKGMPLLLEELKTKGATVIGFTSRRPGLPHPKSTTRVSDDTCELLHGLGYRFTAIKPKTFEVPEGVTPKDGSHLSPFAEEGIPGIYGEKFGTTTFFTGNYPKGVFFKLMIDYLAEFGTTFDAVVGFDDNADNLESIGSVCAKEGLGYTGCHYTFAREHNKWDQTIVDRQLQHLYGTGKYLSVSDARIVILREKIAAQTQVDEEQTEQQDAPRLSM